MSFVPTYFCQTTHAGFSCWVSEQPLAMPPCWLWEVGTTVPEGKVPTSIKEGTAESPELALIRAKRVAEALAVIEACQQPRGGQGNVSSEQDEQAALRAELNKLAKGLGSYAYLEDGILSLGNLPMGCPHCGRQRLNFYPEFRRVDCEKCDWFEGGEFPPGFDQPPIDVEAAEAPLSLDFQSFGPGETPEIRQTVVADSHEEYLALRNALTSDTGTEEST